MKTMTAVSTPQRVPSSPPSSHVRGEQEEKSYEIDLLGLSDDNRPIIVVNASDDDTVPSSTAPHDENVHYQNAKDIGSDDEQEPTNIISGYLNKLGRNGKWQNRFFESDGESLSYFKSAKRSKLLATLDLNKVGTIAISTEDPSGCTFEIQVMGRPYTLRAETKATCRDWVITLNRVKEARLGLGRVKLVTSEGGSQDPGRVVLQGANRKRTSAIQDENDWDNLVKEHQQVTPTVYSTEAISSRAALASWHKPTNALYRIKIRMLQWARSIRGCVEPDEHVLDVHTPTAQFLPPATADYSDRIERTGSKDSSSVEFVAPVETRQLD